MTGQFAGNPRGGEDILRAGEAMGKDGIGTDLPVRKFKPCSQFIALTARETDFL